MIPSTVRFLSYNPVMRVPACPPVSNYSMRPGRWRWLQRLCFWILTRLGCKEQPREPFPWEVISPPPEQIEIHRGKLREVMLRHLDNLRRYDRRPVALLLGPPQYEEAVQGFLPRPIVMAEPFRCGQAEKRWTEEVRVVLVPWMDGAVVVDQDMITGLTEATPGKPFYGIR